jgi:hypothetical protein
MSSLLTVDFKARRSMHQTLRDRKQLQGVAQSVAEHEKRMLRTEFCGGYVLGFISGAGLVCFFLLLRLWVTVGGAS